MHKTTQVILEDKPGALMRAAGLITAMGSNIHSLAVVPDLSTPGRSRLTVVAVLTPRQLDLAVRKLNTLVQVFDAREISSPSESFQSPCPICKEFTSSWTTPQA